MLMMMLMMMIRRRWMRPWMVNLQLDCRFHYWRVTRRKRRLSRELCRLYPTLHRRQCSLSMLIAVRYFAIVAMAMTIMVTLTKTDFGRD